MKTKVILRFTVFLIAASAMAASAPAVQAHLVQTTPSRDMSSPTRRINLSR